MELRPFLKWAGGKTQLLPDLVPRCPTAINRYYEPFAGGAALFLALSSDEAERPKTGVLNDLNESLVTTYAAVRDEPKRLGTLLRRYEAEYLAKSLRDRERYFYEMRESEPETRVKRAARLIFLNKTCYNGLYRENRQGKFNVPHGRYVNPNIADQAALDAVSAILQDSVLLNVDFEDASRFAGPADFVYLDPPFHPLSDTSNFTLYTSKDFDRSDQIRLRNLVDRLTDEGARVMISNSPHPWIKELYAGYRQVEVQARRRINSRGDKRGFIEELVVLNYPEAEERGPQQPITA